MKTAPSITALVLSGLPWVAPASQQQPTSTGARFDVIAIQPNKTNQGGGVQYLPDGGVRAVNIPISMMVRMASPVPVIDVKGLPDWTASENYDITARPFPDSAPTAQQRIEMLNNLLVDRLKMVAHVEQVDGTGFSLVPARTDGRLGPQLTKTALDCAGADAQRCRNSLRFTAGSVEAQGIRMDQFAGSLQNTAGGPVTNRTGLEGWFDIKLSYAPRRLNPAAPPSDAPEFVTAVREQLGLQLVSEKVKLNILVVDHIERPTPN